METYKIFENEHYIEVVYDDAALAEAMQMTPEDIANAIPVELFNREPVGDLKLEAPGADEHGPQEVINMDISPFNAAGTLITNYSKYGDYSSSASLLKRPCLLLTAAHCVCNIDNGNKIFPSSAAFYLQYKNGKYKDKVPIRRFYIPVQHTSNTDPTFDFAICVLARQAGDEGNGLEYSVDLPLNQLATTIGYPGIPISDAKKMMFTKNRVIQHYDSWAVDNGLVAGGSSGGPWVVDGKVIGVNSMGFGGSTTEVSPRLQNEFNELYQNVINSLKIKGFKLKNDAGANIRIGAKYKVSGESVWKKKVIGTSFPLGQSKEFIFADNQIPEGALVRIYAEPVGAFPWTNPEVTGGMVFECKYNNSIATYNVNGGMYNLNLDYTGTTTR